MIVAKNLENSLNIKRKLRQTQLNLYLFIYCIYYHLQKLLIPSLQVLSINMPEILITIPPLPLPIENVSETDGVSTDRSITFTNETPSASGELGSALENSTKCEKNAMHNGKIKKSRKSIGRRNQKKVALKVG